MDDVQNPDGLASPVIGEEKTLLVITVLAVCVDVVRDSRGNKVKVSPTPGLKVGLIILYAAIVLLRGQLQVNVAAREIVCSALCVIFRMILGVNYIVAQHVKGYAPRNSVVLHEHDEAAFILDPGNALSFCAPLLGGIIDLQHRPIDVAFQDVRQGGR